MALVEIVHCILCKQLIGKVAKPLNAGITKSCLRMEPVGVASHSSSERLKARAAFNRHVEHGKNSLKLGNAHLASRTPLLLSTE